MEQVLTAAVCIAVVANLWLFWRIMSDLADGVSVLLGEKKAPDVTGAVLTKTDSTNVVD